MDASVITNVMLSVRIREKRLKLKVIGKLNCLAGQAQTKLEKSRLL